MAELRDKIVEGQGSVLGRNNNSHQLESTLAKIVDYFERRENWKNESDRTTSHVPDNVALERFQKIRPPKFNGEVGE